MVDAQEQKQHDQAQQHPDQDIHLMDTEGKAVVQLLFRVDKMGVAVVQQLMLRLLPGLCSPLGVQCGLLPGQFGFLGSQCCLPRLLGWSVVRS